MGGSTGHYPEDNWMAGTHWPSETSFLICNAVNNLLVFANNWDDDEYIYDGLWVNSNTYAHIAGNAAGFAATQPPNTPGW